MVNLANKVLLAGLLSGLLFAAGFVQHAGAVTTEVPQENITLSPASQRFDVKPGDVKRESFDIRNDSERDYEFIVYGRPYSVANDSYNPDYDAQPANADVYQWVQFDKTTYRIKPHETITVSYTLRVPQNASPGGHYGVLFAETQPEPQDDGGSASVARKKRIGSLVMATVAGDVKLAGESLGSNIEGWQWRPPLSASSSVKNTGNTDFLAKVQMDVKDILGRRLYTKSDNYTIFPGTSRTISIGWSEAPAFGLYKVDLTTSFLDKQQDSSSSYVLIMPRWLVVVLAVAIIAGAIYVILRRRR